VSGRVDREEEEESLLTLIGRGMIERESCRLRRKKYARE
jgi:hypothetical protein